MSNVDEAQADDASIADDVRMLRRIPPSWIHDFRPDSSNFLEKRMDENLSVTAWIVEQDLADVLAEAPHFGVVRVLAGQLRLAGYAIIKVPLDHNPNHCECLGKPSGSQRKALARNARWVHLPADHDPAPYGEIETFAA